MLILFCESCKGRIPAAEIEAHSAVILDESKALCAKCAAARQQSTQTSVSKLASETGVATPEARQSRTGIRPVMREVSAERPSGAFAAAGKVAGGKPHLVEVAPEPPAAPRRGPALAVLLGAGGVVLFVVGLFVALGRGDSVAPAAAGKSATPEPVVPAPPQAAAPKPEAADQDRKLPSWMVADAARPGAERASQGTTAPAEPAKAAPETQPAAAAPAAEPRKATAIAVPAAPDETIWAEDALPAGAKRDGTLRGDSWKWVTPPNPVYSGTQSHTMRVWEGQKPQGVQQHYFCDANPPLHVSPWDVLFAYVYLDPKDPPTEIMMQWQFRGGWEHRAYWGADQIMLGSNFSPSRLQSGPLPQAGTWVRLEVRGSEIGIENEREAVSGWSFDQLAGTAYWDRAGVASRPRPATAAAAPTPPPATQNTTPAPLAKTEAGPAGTATASYVPGTLAKWLWRDFQGGQEYPNHAGKGKTSRTIFNTRTAKPSLWVTFELGYGRYGPGTLVITSLRHDGKEPCRIAILINGQEIFSGPDPATNRAFEWAEHKFPIPSTTLRSGKNELRINNTEDSGKFGFPPWYGVYGVELQGALLPDFPPVVSETRRAAIQTYERVEQLTRKELDPASKLDQALRLAKSVTAPELQPLVSVLEKAQALYSQAVAAMAKTPPAGQVQIEKLKLTGNVVRVAGGKAYVRSQGVEMPVDVALLPQSVFLKALALDESQPSGLADRAAYAFGLGNDEPAQSLHKRVKKENLPAWTALFEQRAALKRLLKFESLVATAEAALKNSMAADALPVLTELGKDYPDLIEANKERMNYLSTLAEGAKK